MSDLILNIGFTASVICGGILSAIGVIIGVIIGIYIGAKISQKEKISWPGPQDSDE